MTDKLPDPLKTRSHADIKVQVFPEPNWAVPNFLPHGLTLLAGRPKHYKSWLALHVGYCVAQGQKVLNHFPAIEPAPALYIALDDWYMTIRDRSDKLRHDPARNLDIVTVEDGGTRTINKGLIHQLALWYDSHPGAKLIMIDVFARVRDRHARSDSYFADFHQLAPLKDFANERNISLWLLHHTRKEGSFIDPMDVISGTTGIGGAADTAMVQYKNDNPEANVILKTRGKFSHDIDLALHFELEAEHPWQYISEAEKDQLRPESRAIINAVEANPGVSAQHIANILNTNPHTTKNIIGRLLHRGLIIKNHPKGYKIPEEGEKL